MGLCPYQSLVETAAFLICAFLSSLSSLQLMYKIPCFPSPEMAFRVVYVGSIDSGADSNCVVDEQDLALAIFVFHGS